LFRENFGYHYLLLVLVVISYCYLAELLQRINVACYAERCSR